MSREDWLFERKGGIGGSDAGAIIGVNPYRSPYSVWADKLGKLPEIPDNEAKTSVHSIPKRDIVKLEARILIKNMTLERLIKYLDAHAYDDLVVSGDPKGDVYKTTIFSGEVGVQENRQSMIDSVNCTDWGWER